MLFQRERAISVWAFLLRWKQSALKKDRSARPSCEKSTQCINLITNRTGGGGETVFDKSLYDFEAGVLKVLHDRPNS